MSDQSDRIEVQSSQDRAVSLGPPAGSVLACTAWARESAVYFGALLLFRRTETLDELWSGICIEEEVLEYASPAPEGSDRQEVDFERSVIAPRAGEERDACLRLLAELVRSQGPFLYLTEDFMDPGLVDQESYLALIDAENRAAKERMRVSREMFSGTEIVRTAESCGLGPRPSDGHPELWYATCPGTNHRMEMQPAKNLFYCGYCRRGGTPADLAVFHGERRERRGLQGGNDTSAVTGK